MEFSLTEIICCNIDSPFGCNVYFHGGKCYVANGSAVEVFNVITGKHEETINTGLRHHITFISVSRKGDFLFTTDTSETSWRFDLVNKIGLELKSSFSGGNCIIEGPTGFVFECGGQDEIRMLDVRTGARTKGFRGFTKRPLSLLYSQTRSMLFAGMPDGTVCYWDINAKINNSGVCTIIYRLKKGIYAMAWDNEKEAKIILRARHQIAILNIEEDIMEMIFNDPDVHFAALAPDLRHYITTNKEDRLFLYSAECYMQIDLKLEVKSMIYNPFHFSPDGCFLAIIDQQGLFRLFKCSISLSVAIQQNKILVDPQGIFEKSESNNIDGRTIVAPQVPVIDLKLTAADGFIVDNYKLVSLLQITQNISISLISPLVFSVSHGIESPIYFKAITSQDANEWVDAISAVRSNLNLEYKDRWMMPKPKIIKKYRFDLLQLINSLNGGKGLLPGKTVPKDAMQLIGFYTIE